MKFTRITVDPGKMGGVPCIRGLRVPVATIVSLIASGMTMGEVLKEYPDVEAEDIKEALEFAAEAVTSSLLFLNGLQLQKNWVGQFRSRKESPCTHESDYQK